MTQSAIKIQFIFTTNFPTSRFEGYWVRLNRIDRQLGDPLCYQIQFIFTPNVPANRKWEIVCDLNRIDGIGGIEKKKV